MDQIRSIGKLKAPYGGQEVELQHVDFEGGSLPLLRIRIRERSRFTIFDIDASMANEWSAMLAEWARAQSPSE